MNIRFAKNAGLPDRESTLWLRTGVAVSLILLLAFASVGYAQEKKQQSNEYKQKRSRAFDLYNRNNFMEAVPLLEALREQDPDDLAVLERLAYALFGSSAGLENEEERRQVRARARRLALKAKEKGVQSQLLEVVIDSIPEDGGLLPFSGGTEAEKYMQDGETAFVKGDFSGALEAYKRAFLLNPKSYEAALFSGDVHYKMRQHEEAAEWFARAIAIDPNRETAHRYWGDSLMAFGRMEETFPKLIEAVVSEPYNRTAWYGLINWAKQEQVQLAHPNIQSPNQSSKKEDGTYNITIDVSIFDKKDGTDAWLFYEISRTAWRMKIFSKKFPKKKEYRHTLMEETDSLRGVVESVENQMKEGKIETLHPSLKTLLELHKDGLLEAYVLISRADKGIVQDYESYRNEHRDKLLQYVKEYIVQREKPEAPNGPVRGGG